MTSIKDIKSLLPEELPDVLREELAVMNEPQFRAKQIFAWLARGVQSFDEMTDLPTALRETLKVKISLTTLRLLKKRTSRDGTSKLLYELHDGETIETAVMRYDYGTTVCVSTQVGCRMGCAFCAGTIGGIIRNLSAGEILDQVLRSETELGEKITGVVLMGIGEPLDNYDNVVRFLELVTHKDGRNIGSRHISLSTCGITENIDKLARLGIQLTLSISLHAPDDETRSKLMPINKKYGVKKIIASAAAYQKATGRRVTYEYALVRGINDSPEHAERLAALLQGTGQHVNLIRLNSVPGRSLEGSSQKTAEVFRSILAKKGIPVTIRRRLGADIEAACGQLRRAAENISK